jgi:hypothetical protein
MMKWKPLHKKHQSLFRMLIFPENANKTALIFYVCKGSKFEGRIKRRKINILCGSLVIRRYCYKSLMPEVKEVYSEILLHAPKLSLIIRNLYILFF